LGENALVPSRAALPLATPGVALPQYNGMRTALAAATPGYGKVRIGNVC
jgi:hypothetical protein